LVNAREGFAGIIGCALRHGMHLIDAGDVFNPNSSGIDWNTLTGKLVWHYATNYNELTSARVEASWCRQS